MIVVGIIGLLAAISIPLYLRSRLQANETAAIATIKQLIAAEEMWRCSNPDYGYMIPLDTVQPSYTRGCGFSVDPSQWRCKYGYGFYIWNSVNPGSYQTAPQNYFIWADPQIAGCGTNPGAHHFCSDVTGVVRYFNGNPINPPTCSGNAIGQ